MGSSITDDRTDGVLHSITIGLKRESRPPILSAQIYPRGFETQRAADASSFPSRRRSATSTLTNIAARPPRPMLADSGETW